MGSEHASHTAGTWGAGPGRFGLYPREVCTPGGSGRTGRRGGGPRPVPSPRALRVRRLRLARSLWVLTKGGTFRDQGAAASSPVALARSPVGCHLHRGSGHRRGSGVLRRRRAPRGASNVRAGLAGRHPQSDRFGLRALPGEGGGVSAAARRQRQRLAGESTPPCGHHHANERGRSSEGHLSPPQRARSQDAKAPST